MDRNHLYASSGVDFAESLSARRAWIEIRCMQCFLFFFYVALRKESVDRNLIDEIQLEFNSVALRKESVDRNFIHLKHS